MRPNFFSCVSMADCTACSCLDFSSFICTHNRHTKVSMPPVAPALANCAKPSKHYNSSNANPHQPVEMSATK